MAPTNDHEMQAFVALQIAMGLCSKPSVKDYWSKYWLTNTKFGDVMSRTRYEKLNKILHFADNEAHLLADNDDYDPLYKVRALMDETEPLLESVYIPDRELSLDESIIKFKGRIFFNSIIPTNQTSGE